jgi:hypothetical protein
MPKSSTQTIWVYQQNQSARGKIQAIDRFAKNTIDLKVISIDSALPLVIDEATGYLPQPRGADLVLDHLKHSDLSHALAYLCRQSGIPVIASGKKPPLEDALTPRICCALTQQKGLGEYGRLFGRPEFRIIMEAGRIREVKTLRGAPCAATWDAARRIVGLDIETAKTRIGLETQFFCVADPSAWDPITGKSPVHTAAELHKAALVRALRELASRSRNTTSAGSRSSLSESETDG